LTSQECQVDIAYWYHRVLSICCALINEALLEEIATLGLNINPHRF
jgi:hypothetical protein